MQRVIKHCDRFLAGSVDSPSASAAGRGPWCVRADAHLPSNSGGVLSASKWECKRAAPLTCCSEDASLESSEARWTGFISCGLLSLPSVCLSISGPFPALGACQGWGPYPGSRSLHHPTAGGLRAPCVPRLAAWGDLLSRACCAAEPGCQMAPILAAPPHLVFCEGHRPLQHSALPLSNHLPGAWHYPSALLPQAAPQGFILPRDSSFVSPERAGGAG